MSVKKIVVNAEELICTDVYPYRYDQGKGKEVLRISISEADADFAKIKRILANCTHPIEFFVDDVQKNVYENYSYDFSCNYLEGVFSVEITRASELERKIFSLESSQGEVQALSIAKAKSEVEIDLRLSKLELGLV